MKGFWFPGFFRKKPDLMKGLGFPVFSKKTGFNRTGPARFEPVSGPVRLIFL
jgi:hypothetical protein